MTATPEPTRRTAVRDFVSARLLQPAQAFVHTEVAGGAVVLFAAALAFAWANSPWDGSYSDLWHSRVVIDTGLFSLDKDVVHLVNDGLMAIFFFVIGLETKRELLHGQLATVRKATLPVAAALGGMVVPALIYTAFNFGGDGAKGWGIPMATDIAFALGVLALVGTRAPFALKIFLLALAVVDDIGAILVIAVFYTDSIALDAAITAIAVFAGIFAAQRAGIRGSGLYVILAVVFWLAVLKSGVHATIAGVLLALITPSRPMQDIDTFQEQVGELLTGSEAEELKGPEAQQTAVQEVERAVRRSQAPLDRLERMLHPWVVFLIVPIFALANAGISISGDELRAASESAVTGGIVFGLVLGKPVGIVLFAWLAVRTGIARLPDGVRWAQIAGAGLLGGVGFTVALFITDLAFTSETLTAEAKMGIVGASIVAAAGGYLILRFLSPSAVEEPVTEEPA